VLKGGEKEEKNSCAHVRGMKEGTKKKKPARPSWEKKKRRVPKRDTWRRESLAEGGSKEGPKKKNGQARCRGGAADAGEQTAERGTVLKEPGKKRGASPGEK